jgi:NAD(P)-dependent dehydrogenase (short-subunit alcohol dehydrogenase family)
VADLGGGVAVITGAGSGLGAAMADVFAGAGLAVVALDLDADRASATERALRDQGCSALSAGVDVADLASLEAAAELTRATFDRCTVVCANVGVQQFGALDRLSDQDWQWVLSTNVLGTVHTVNAFLPLLRATSGARHVVLTASSAVFTPAARLGAYAATKYAVVGYGEALRLELEPEGIGVSILFPSGMSTRHLESSAAARPAALGPSVTRDDDIDVMLASRDYDPGADVLAPELAVRSLLRDLGHNRRYIITHGDFRDQLVARGRELLDAYDRRSGAAAPDDGSGAKMSR